MFETITATVHITCPFCQQEHRVENVPIKGYGRWHKGESIQRALPELTPHSARTADFPAMSRLSTQGLRVVKHPRALSVRVPSARTEFENLTNFQQFSLRFFVQNNYLTNPITCGIILS